MRIDVLNCYSRPLAAVVCGLWLLVPPLLLAQTNTAPTVTIEPFSGVTAQGEDFVFVAAATGTPPLAYQWSLNGQNLPGATNAVLFLTNLTNTQAGRYSVTVANAAGSVTNHNAYLTVQATNTVRRLETGRVLPTGSQVAVPIRLRANGREHSVAFSLSFDTNHYANPVFLPADTNALVTVSNRPGAIGLAETLPAGKTFAPGFPWIGVMRFDLVTTNSQLLGGLQFTTNLFPLAAANSNGLALTISAQVLPQFVLATAQPRLDRQSGLFTQKVLVSNPGAFTLTNINLFALQLGADSRTNAILLYNATASMVSSLVADPVVAVGDACCGYSLDAASGCDAPGYLACGSPGKYVDYTGTALSLPYGQIASLAPGQTIVFNSEFYVSDHATVPQPSYSITADGVAVRVVGTTTKTLSVTRYLYDAPNQRFIIQFPTSLGKFYYVQYAGSASDLGTTNAQTALPAIYGTGSAVQWIDNGPPKTISVPTNGGRFYQVLEAL